jgi:hypothetical protein
MPLIEIAEHTLAFIVAGFCPTFGPTPRDQASRDPCSAALTEVETRDILRTIHALTRERGEPLDRVAHRPIPLCLPSRSDFEKAEPMKPAPPVTSARSTTASGWRASLQCVAAVEYQWRGLGDGVPVDSYLAHQDHSDVLFR